ncbi:MAG: extracellular solute-binding protein, partial [Spirochaetaceae bacterium]|nr:extracellular solute-binding protein [Spirochaetaceae bacterium]
MDLRKRIIGWSKAASAVAAALLIASLLPAPAFAAPAKEITIWVNSADAQPLQNLYKIQFTKDTGTKVNVVSFPSDGFEVALMQRWATGDRPDVLEWHANFGQLVEVNPKDNLRDLSKEPFIAKQLPGINAGFGGATYGIVLNTPTAWGIYYNKPIFKRLNLTPPTTAAELEKVCLAIKKADPSIVPLQESAGSMWPPLVTNGQFTADALKAGFLQRLIDRKAKVNDPDSPWLRSLTFYKKLQAEGCFNSDIMTAKFENAASLLLEGKVAMVSLHSGFVQLAVDASSKDTVDTTIGFVEWSENKPVVTVEYSPNGTFYLPKTGDKNREAAALGFMNYITGPAYSNYVKAAGMIPTLKGVAAPASIPKPLLEI